LFAATYFASKNSTESWLVDSECTNHMTHDQELFKELDRSKASRVRIGNGVFITAEGKGTVAIESCQGTKLIYDVLYVPEIGQNLLSVGQLLEKGLKLNFEDNHCSIKDAYNKEMFSIKMSGRSFTLDPMRRSK